MHAGFWQGQGQCMVICHAGQVYLQRIICMSTPGITDTLRSCDASFHAFCSPSCCLTGLVILACCFLKCIPLDGFKQAVDA